MAREQEQEMQQKPPPRRQRRLSTKTWAFMALVTITICLIALNVINYMFVTDLPSFFAWWTGRAGRVITTFLVFTTVTTVLLNIGSRFRWTGLRGRTLWDWLQLLIIPTVIAVLGISFTAVMQRSQQEIEERRAQHDVLQAYLNDMSGLLLDEKLRTSPPNSEVRMVARVRTLAVLNRFGTTDVRYDYQGRAVLEGPRQDANASSVSKLLASVVGTTTFSSGDRKRDVVQFLYQSDLIVGNEPVISLDGANLSGAILCLGTPLEEGVACAPHSPGVAEFTLKGANLSGADLTGANLSQVDLTGADLSGTTLFGADLSWANLTNADLYGANLNTADLYQADLAGASLRCVGMSGWELQEAKSLKEATVVPAWQNPDKCDVDALGL